MFREVFYLKNKCYSIYVYACHKQSFSSAMISAKFSGGKKIVALRSSLANPLMMCNVMPIDSVSEGIKTRSAYAENCFL
jgi:hypothetical protein